MLLQCFRWTAVDMGCRRWHSVQVRFIQLSLCAALFLGACATSEEPAGGEPTPSPQSDVVDVGSEDVVDEDISPVSDATVDVIAGDVTGDDADTLDVWPDVDSAVSAEAVALTDNELWTKTISAMDPWWGEDAEEELCEPADYGPETTPIGMLFDIDTSFCGYITIGQPLLAEVPVGETFRVKLVQYAQTESEGPYLLAIAIGEPAVTIWEMTIEVPSDFQVVDQTWTAARTYLADEPVYFHLSNHGENTWSFVNLTLEPAAE